MIDRYIIENGVVRPESDTIKWGEWFEGADRHIEKTEGVEYVVSTVFLGLDHSFGEGPPILFETMVFKRSDWDALGTPDSAGLTEQDMERYGTIEEAMAGHEAVVSKWDKNLSSTQRGA